MNQARSFGEFDHSIGLVRENNAQQSARSHQKQMLSRYLHRTHQDSQSVAEALQRQGQLENSVDLESDFYRLMLENNVGQDSLSPVDDVSGVVNEVNPEMSVVVDTEREQLDIQADSESGIFVVDDEVKKRGAFDKYFHLERQRECRRAYSQNFVESGNCDTVSLEEILIHIQYIDYLTKVVEETETHRFLKRDFDDCSIINFLETKRQLEIIREGAQQIIDERRRLITILVSEYYLRELDESLEEPITSLDLSFLDPNQDFVIIYADGEVEFGSSDQPDLNYDPNQPTFEGLHELTESLQQRLMESRDNLTERLIKTISFLNQNNITNQEYRQAVELIEKFGFQIPDHFPRRATISLSDFQRLLNVCEDIDGIQKDIKRGANLLVDLLLLEINDE